MSAATGPDRFVLMENIIRQADRVRAKQKAYWQPHGRKPYQLEESKRAERKLDALIAAYYHGTAIATQPSLIDQPGGSQP